MRSQLALPRASADALAIARLACPGQTFALITAQAHDAERLAEEIAWFDSALAVCRLPDWETLPWDPFSPHPDLISERLATLYRLARGTVDVLLMPVATALQRLVPRSYLDAHSFMFKHKAKLDIEELRSRVVASGYSAVAQVYAPGEFSVRGGLVDLFPMGSSVPYRIDLLDDEIESIRVFDVDTQRTIYSVSEVRLLPAREIPLDDGGRARFRSQFRDRFEGDPSKSRIYKDVSAGLAPPGIEYYLPLFFEHTATIFDYLPPDARVAIDAASTSGAESFWRDLTGRYTLLRGDAQRPILPPEALYLRVDEFFGVMASRSRIDVTSEGDGATVAALPALDVDRRANDPLSRLRQFITSFEGRVVVCGESLGRRETIKSLCAEHGIALQSVEAFADVAKAQAGPLIVAAPLAQGFVLARERLAIVTEKELYADQVRQTRRREAKGRSNVDAMIRDLAEVSIGDPVVHAEHGIGRYMGLLTLDLGEGETEFLHLEYEGGDKLYVPVAQLGLISRYSGASQDAAPLHKLGSGQWEKAKRKAAEQVRDTAAELLNLYAQRASRQGFAFPVADHDLDAFAATFAFEETPDQAGAIAAVVGDMRSGKPMDRLVCGDVGFGKTEVAMRAAFVALSAGTQVALLVPTTLLAEQHYLNFTDRLAEWPFKLVELSRFRSAKEQADALKGLADGRIDMVIGTHRLLQKDIVFKALGLVIIDEEHRFGVRQKERLKQLRAQVDVLTLTATPIPRTLAMSLEGLRDFSVIATAPQKRLAIKTFVQRYSDGVVREAVMRELRRGGQAYYLYNEVETIANTYDKLTRLLPEARIAIAHGQLRERELESVMRDFYHQRSNVLLCSTIIETGIDVPTANTILIHRADRFGLAQLHQLRGRVGRSHHQAYAYLLTPDEQALSPAANKRLEAIQMLEDLGSGFYLSMHDLEIRGAGEVLGESQSGGIQDIGFTLYTDMLAHAVRSLKKGKEPDLAEPLAIVTEINLRAPALLPTDYCGDVHERLVLYKRLANCESVEALDALKEELIDRFGVLPDASDALIESHRLRLLGQPLGLVKLDAGSDSLTLQFRKDAPIDPNKLLKLMHARKRARFAGPERVRIETPMPTLADRINESKHFLRELAA